MDAPRLIESSAKDFLYSTLSKCHNNRVHIYTIALNLGVLLGFLIVTFTILYYCYKKKPSEYEAKQKLLRDQQYILSKIRFYQGENVERRTSDITALPIMR